MTDQNERNDAVERRRHQRLAKRYPLRYRYLLDLAAAAGGQSGEVVDISGGGVRFLTPEPIEVGSQLALTIEFAGWQEGDDEWRPGSAADVGELQVIAIVTRTESSIEAAGRYQVSVRFCGRIS